MPIGSVDWIEDGMLQGELRQEDGRYSFDVRNQFFHGAHPLGWVRSITVTVDGVQAHDISLTVRGQRLPLELLRATSDIWWHPREVATVGARLPEPVRSREPYVECTFKVSTFFFTPAIDREDRYPTMSLDLRRRLSLRTEENA
ncbi:hypothetical protein [Streptomyces sp. NPDC002276]